MQSIVVDVNAIVMLSLCFRLFTYYCSAITMWTKQYDDMNCKSFHQQVAVYWCGLLPSTACSILSSVAGYTCNSNKNKWTNKLITGIMYMCCFDDNYISTNFFALKYNCDFVWLFCIQITMLYNGTSRWHSYVLLSHLSLLHKGGHYTVFSVVFHVVMKLIMQDYMQQTCPFCLVVLWR